MARHCSVCSRHDRSRLESLILAGESISQIAIETSLSQAALYRHLRAHVAPELRVALRGSAVDTPLLVERMVQIADDARDARREAYAAGSIVGATRAGDSELRALTTLIDRLGIDTTEIHQLLHDGQQLATAVGNAVRSNLALGSLIIAELRALGATEAAAALSAALPTSTIER